LLEGLFDGVLGRVRQLVGQQRKLLLRLVTTEATTKKKRKRNKPPSDSIERVHRLDFGVLWMCTARNFFTIVRFNGLTSSSLPISPFF